MRAHNPFIVDLRFAFQTPTKFYLGLEYLSGGELFYHMERRGILPLPDARFYVAEIAVALNYLHRISVVYRDLKPENVVLDSDGHVKLVDFGISKELLAGERATAICGMAEYMAPEMVLHEPYSYEVDFWMLGILFFELLTESTPFYSDSKERMVDAIAHSHPNLDAISDRHAASLIRALLVKSPNDRMTFSEMQKHSFFEGYDWSRIANREYQPPFVPPDGGSGDPVNFDHEFTNEMTADWCPYVCNGMPVLGGVSRSCGVCVDDMF
jgi:serine/threonine protein kinase